MRGPILRLHVGRVDGRTKGNGFDVIVETRKFRHEVADVLPIKGFECASGGIFEHANRAASVDDEYPSSVHVMICFCKYTFFWRNYLPFRFQKNPPFERSSQQGRRGKKRLLMAECWRCVRKTDERIAKSDI